MRWAALGVLVLALLLVPFLLFEEQFERLATWLAEGNASGWGTASAIGALLAFDVFLPVPSSIVSTAAGALLGFWRGAMVVWTGMTAGCLIAYALGSGASQGARRLVGPGSLARAHDLSQRFGAWAILICRPVPVLAEATVVLAGIVRAPLGPFVALTASSNLGIAIAYSAVGAFSMRMQSFLLTFVGAVALPGLALLLAKLWLARRGAAPAK
jgi:uncharacterized membrane protein YdjX (TVP38/TMEM64 family)